MWRITAKRSDNNQGLLDHYPCVENRIYRNKQDSIQKRYISPPFIQCPADTTSWRCFKILSASQLLIHKNNLHLFTVSQLRLLMFRAYQLHFFDHITNTGETLYVMYQDCKSLIINQRLAKGGEITEFMYERIGLLYNLYKCVARRENADKTALYIQIQKEFTQRRIETK